MFCPVCHSEIADNTEVCPACHADLSVTRALPKLTGTYCVSCGALVPAGSSICPHCGIAVDAATLQSGVHISPKSLAGASHSTNIQGRALSNLPDIDELDETETTHIMPKLKESANQTHTMPRLDSAIPAEPTAEEEENYGASAVQRTRIFAIAAIASLVIIGGAAVLITHPWNPLQNNQRATTAADVSTAGYPGEVEHLSGQDKEEAKTAVDADEQTYNYLTEYHTELAQLSKDADDLEDLLDTTGVSGTADERASGYEDAQQLSLDISNLVTKIAGVDTSATGTYTQDQENLSTLGNWLRNRIEALERAWKLSAQSSDPTADTSSILAPMQGNRRSDGSEAYVNLFDENYAAWAVEEK